MKGIKTWYLFFSSSTPLDTWHNSKSETLYLSQFLIVELVFLHLLCSVSSSLSCLFLSLVISVKSHSGLIGVSTLCYNCVSQRTRPSLTEMLFFHTSLTAALKDPQNRLSRLRNVLLTSAGRVSIQQCRVRERDF